MGKKVVYDLEKISALESSPFDLSQAKAASELGFSRGALHLWLKRNKIKRQVKVTYSYPDTKD
jgi:hypothetical protein